MPRVPQAENNVRIAGLPSARSNVSYTPEAFGAGVGRGLEQVAGVVVDYAQKEREKQDRAALMGAERQLQEWQNQALFAPDSGAFAQRGKNAFGLPDRILPDWDKQVGAVESGLSDRQRAIFRERAGNMRVSMERDLMRHVGSEAEQFQKQETTALVTTRLDTAMLYWKDPARFDKELREAQSVFLAGNDGLPPAAAQVGLTEIESKARAGVVNKMIEESPLEAQRYFDTYRDKMTEADRAQVERVLKPARLDAEADNEIARATGRAVPGMSPPPDYATYRRRLESGGRSDAKASTSSATGADQFVDETWLRTVHAARPDAFPPGVTLKDAIRSARDGKSSIPEVQALLDRRKDSAFSGQMADALDQQNIKALERAGQPPTVHNLYASHHFGEGGGVAFARAEMNTPMEDILSPGQISANGYLRGKTKAEAIANWDRRAGAQAGAPATGAPASKAEVLTRLSEITDPQVRKLAIQKYAVQLDIEKAAELERQEAFTESINTKVESATPGAPLRQILTPQEYAWAAEQGKIDTWENRMKQRLAGTEPITNPALFDSLQSTLIRAENGDAKAIAEVRAMDVSKLFTGLDRQSRDYIQNRRMAIIGSKGDKDKKLDFASEDELLNVEAFDKLGISKNPQKEESEETKSLRLQFMKSYWAAIESKQLELGRGVTSAERQQVIRDQLLPFAKKVRDSFLGIGYEKVETKRGFEIGAVPDRDRQLIVEAYSKVHGVTPSDAQIRAEYLRAQGYAPQMESE